jgi:hypothetical protein
MCKCDCGTSIKVVVASLIRSNTKSCGCIHREHIKRLGHKNAANLAGSKFGRLTAVKFSGRKIGTFRVWDCVCDCGKQTEVLSANLTSGNSQSCGCLNKERLSQSRRVDIAGRVFGKLTAIECVAGDKKGERFWRASCLCGGEKVVQACRLTTGAIISCGCATGGPIANPYMPEHALEKGRIAANERRARKMKAGGSFDEFDIDLLYEEQGGRCPYCRTELGDHFQRDHIVALINGGSNDIGNIQLLDPRCHFLKTAMDRREAAARRRNTP